MASAGLTPDAARTLDQSHETTCRLLQEKTQLMLDDKRRELDDLLEKDVDSVEMAQVIERLRNDILDLENDPEYLAYMSEFSRQLVVDPDDASESGSASGVVADAKSTGVMGPIGRFVSQVVVSDAGQQLRRHESQHADPLREWHTEYQQRRANDGRPAKRKRKRRPPRAVPPRFVPIECPVCKGPLTEASAGSGGARVCQRDGYSTMEGNTTDHVTMIKYEDRHDVIMAPTKGGYRRGNHMSECLNQRMGKESTKIPTEVIEAVLEERRKHAWMDINDIEWRHMREWLAKNGMSRWYEHIPRIFRIVTGRELPSLDEAQEDKVRKMFQLLEDPFEKCPTDIRQRDNFPSYEYTLYKICELCGYDEMLPGFKLLKSAEKLAQHDTIWKYFCSELGWEFIPTPVL